MFKFILSAAFLFCGSAHAANVVATFDCQERSTGLRATGSVTQSSSEEWRFFMKITLSNGKSETIETRYYQGQDVGSNERVSGYMRSGVVDYRETRFGNKPGPKTLDLTYRPLTGDRATHEFMCR